MYLKDEVEYNEVTDFNTIHNPENMNATMLETFGQLLKQLPEYKETGAAKGITFSLKEQKIDMGDEGSLFFPKERYSVVATKKYLGGKLFGVFNEEEVVAEIKCMNQDYHPELYCIDYTKNTAKQPSNEATPPAIKEILQKTLAQAKKIIASWQDEGFGEVEFNSGRPDGGLKTKSEGAVAAYLDQIKVHPHNQQNQVLSKK